MFRARIELKQIGVRDEAKRLGGIGRCGREYCSASWLPDLRPVNLGVAKDQRLSLNPQQISGACGRLMCCLRYEHEFYVQSRRRFPKEGKILRTAVGDEKVIACDIFNERITLRTAEGDTRVVLLAELREQVGGFGDSTAVDRTETADAGAANSTRDRDDFVPDHDAPVGPVTLSSHTNVREEEDDDEPNAFDDAVDDGLDDALDEDEEPSGIDAEASEGASVTSPGESAEARRKRRRGRRGGRRLRAADARRSGEHPTVQPPAPDRNATDADGHGGSDGAPSRTPLT